MNPNVSDQQQTNQGKVNFKCSDAGLKNCDWQVSGNGEQEIMRKIEQHGREKHGSKSTTTLATGFSTLLIGKRHRYSGEMFAQGDFGRPFFIGARARPDGEKTAVQNHF